VIQCISQTAHGVPERAGAHARLGLQHQPIGFGAAGDRWGLGAIPAAWTLAILILDLVDHLAIVAVASQPHGLARRLFAGARE
jgi:hypothetical protein